MMPRDTDHLQKLVNVQDEKIDAAHRFLLIFLFSTHFLISSYHLTTQTYESDDYKHAEHVFN